MAEWQNGRMARRQSGREKGMAGVALLYYGRASLHWPVNSGRGDAVIRALNFSLGRWNKHRSPIRLNVLFSVLPSLAPLPFPFTLSTFVLDSCCWCSRSDCYYCLSVFPQFSFLYFPPLRLVFTALFIHLYLRVIPISFSFPFWDPYLRIPQLNKPFRTIQRLKK